MNIKIDIFSDVVCPWCYVGKKRLERALAQRPGDAVEILWHPFQLNPAAPAAGLPRQEYLSRKFGGPERLRMLDARMKEVGAAEGIDFRQEKIARTPNTLEAHRLMWWAAQDGRQNALADALFRAYFTEGRDIGDRAVLAGVAGAAGLDPARAAAFLTSAEGREEVLGEERMAKDAGLNAVPFFIINNQTVVQGAEAPEIFLQAIEKSAPGTKAGGTCGEGACQAS